MLQNMHLHPCCAQIDIATRANPLNNFFFKNFINKGLFVNEVN